MVVSRLNPSLARELREAAEKPTMEPLLGPPKQFAPKIAPTVPP
jgi:hypothetical protein